MTTYDLQRLDDALQAQSDALHDDLVAAYFRGDVDAIDPILDQGLFNANDFDAAYLRWADANPDQAPTHAPDATDLLQMVYLAHAAKW